MRGSKANKKGFKFESDLIAHAISLDYLSEQVDTHMFCESIGDTSRDKIDLQISNPRTNSVASISAKCPSNTSSIQMSSFTIDRQLRYLEYRLKKQPGFFRDFMTLYFGDADRKVWEEVNKKYSIDVSMLDPRNELRRQRTLLPNIPQSLIDKVKAHVDDPDFKRVFLEMHLISGFTDRPADYQIWHPAKKEEDFDFSGGNFYLVDLETMKSLAESWKWEFGKSTINLGPLNWKVRGGGGDACTPSDQSYHNAQCFSGISKIQKFASDAITKGTLKEILEVALP